MPLKEKDVAEHVITSLGGEDVGVELTPKDIQVCIKDAVRRYSRKNPLRNREAKICQAGAINSFELPFGTYEVSDVELQNSLQIFETANSQEFNLFNSWNMIAQGGMGGGISAAEEYALTLMWRQMTMRVYSLEPDYYVDWDRQLDEGGDDPTRVLPLKIYLFNPTGLPLRASYVALSERTLDRVGPDGEDWILSWCLAHAKEILGRKRGKFSIIPNAGQQLTLDGEALLSEASSEKIILLQELEDRTHFEYPIWG